jgi:hypothetical protein
MGLIMIKEVRKFGKGEGFSKDLLLKPQRGER